MNTYTINNNMRMVHREMTNQYPRYHMRWMISLLPVQLCNKHPCQWGVGELTALTVILSTVFITQRKSSVFSTRGFPPPNTEQVNWSHNVPTSHNRWSVHRIYLPHTIGELFTVFTFLTQQVNCLQYLPSSHNRWTVYSIYLPHTCLL